MVEATKLLRSKKCAGIDGATNEALKAGGGISKNAVGRIIPPTRASATFHETPLQHMTLNCGVEEVGTPSSLTSSLHGFT